MTVTYIVVGLFVLACIVGVLRVAWAGELGVLFWVLSMTALAFVVAVLLVLTGYSLHYGVPIWDLPW